MKTITVFGMLTPFLFTVWGSVSESYGIASPVYYASIGYVMATISMICIYEGDKN